MVSERKRGACGLGLHGSGVLVSGGGEALILAFLDSFPRHSQEGVKVELERCTELVLESLWGSAAAHQGLCLQLTKTVL